MSLNGLDIDGQMLHLRRFSSNWSQRTEGEVTISRGDQIWFEVIFRVMYYRVWLKVIIGPRGGVKEWITIVDDRPKQAEVDHLTLFHVVEVGLAPEDTFMARCIGKVKRKNLDEGRIVRLIQEEVSRVQQDPVAYLRFIEAKEVIGVSHPQPNFVEGGMSRK